MSITKEQAAAWFEAMHPPGPAAREMYRMAAKVLRPVSREQVEKVLRGEWEPIGADKRGRGGIFRCTRCRGSYPVKNDFCPHCGAPMTDEAVEMVMERLEALKDGKGD